MKVIGYARVSTTEQAVSGLGVEAQREAIRQEGERRGWKVTHVDDSGYSAKDLDRPGIKRALKMLGEHKADALCVAKLDRVTRSMLDFAGLMEQARKEGWSIVALDLGVDTTTAAGEMLANVLATFAHYERRIIGERTKDALRAAQARGTRLGRPVDLPDSVRRRIVRFRGRGVSLAKIADRLNAEHVPTARGGASWYPSTVDKVLQSAERDGLLVPQSPVEGGTKESSPPRSRKGSKTAPPGADKFLGEAKYDVGQIVQHEGSQLVIGGIAKGADGFTYMLRAPGSRKQVFASEGSLRKTTNDRRTGKA